MKRRRTPEATRVRILSLDLHVLSRHPDRTWALAMTPRTAGVWLAAQLESQGGFVASGGQIMEPALSGRFVLRVSSGRDGEVIAVPLDSEGSSDPVPGYRLDLTTGLVVEHEVRGVVVPLPRRPRHED